MERDSVREDVLRILSELRDDWEISTPITESTGLFRELGFESIDAVALGSSLEEFYGHNLPFAEFLTRIREQEMPDVTVGMLLDFLMVNLPSAGSARVGNARAQ